VNNPIAEALGRGDAVTAFEHIDRLPEAERAPWLVAAWRLVGSPARLGALIGGADAAPPELADLVRWGVPETPLPGACAKAAADGRAHDLAYLHLALAACAPRVDLRAAHLAHAETLAGALGDRRLAVWVAASEAALDADLGEDDDALERAAWALAEAAVVGAPLAAALAERAHLIARERPRHVSLAPNDPPGEPADD
jgi:hypothetical protein